MLEGIVWIQNGFISEMCVLYVWFECWSIRWDVYSLFGNFHINHLIVMTCNVSCYILVLKLYLLIRVYYTLIISSIYSVWVLYISFALYHPLTTDWIIIIFYNHTSSKICILQSLIIIEILPLHITFHLFHIFFIIYHTFWKAFSAWTVNSVDIS